MLNTILWIVMCPLRPILVLLFVANSSSALWATLIDPPADMNQMIEQCELIVYGEVIGHNDEYGSINSFKIKESYKGGLISGQLINLQEYSWRSETEITVVNGDVDFKIGAHYLLFLFRDGSGNYKPQLLSLSVYEEMSNKGQKQFVHHQSILDICYLSDVHSSLIDSYRVDEFQSVLRFNQDFTLTGIPRETVDKIKQIGVAKKSTCAQPSHCTALIGDENQLNGNCNIGSNLSPAKHISSTFTVKVASDASSDPSQSNAMTLLVNAVAELNNLNGLSVNLASPIIQTCQTTNCTRVRDVVDTVCNPNSLNEIWVFFNDPCDEVADLVNCGGLLGIGGTFAKTPCHTDACGDMWLSAYAPYFVMNNGSGCLNDYNYTSAIIHEMMHSLNLSHINGSCTALMNGGLCHSNANTNAPNYGIKQLDIECIEWMYNQCPVNESFAGITYPNSYSDPEFAQNQITASNILIQNGADMTYDAGSMIEMNPLFEVELGAVFHALIGGCLP